MGIYNVLTVNNSSISSVEKLCQSLTFAKNGNEEELNHDFEFNITLNKGITKSIIRKLNNSSYKNNYSNLLVPSSAIELISYDLLRSMQDNNWRVVICDDIEVLLLYLKSAEHKKGIDLYEKKIELIRKFRLDVDYYLSFPSSASNESDAELVLNYLISNKIRLVSFFYQKLLAEILPGSNRFNDRSSKAQFFTYIFDCWKANRNTILIDDIHRTLLNLLSHYDPELRKDYRVYYIKNNNVFKLIEGEEYELHNGLSKKEIIESLGPCEKTCEYYSICKGDLFSNKHFYNNTIYSSKNEYCEKIKIPYLGYLIDNFSEKI